MNTIYTTYSYESPFKYYVSILAGVGGVGGLPRIRENMLREAIKNYKILYIGQRGEGGFSGAVELFIKKRYGHVIG